MAKVSMSYLFSFSSYQTKCVIKFLFRRLMDDIINFKIYLGSSSQAMTEWEKKGEGGNTNI